MKKMNLIVVFDKGFIKSYFLRFLDNKTDFDSLSDFMSALTTARYDLWLNYINEMLCHPFIAVFGAGLGAVVLPPNNLSPHSLYISSIYQLGIIGTVLFCSIIVYMVVKYYKRNRIKPTIAIVVACGVWIFLSFVEDLIFYMY